jgi:hypothetical protein
LKSQAASSNGHKAKAWAFFLFFHAIFWEITDYQDLLEGMVASLVDVQMVLGKIHDRQKIFYFNFLF